MNAVSILRNTEVMGAREFRHRLDIMLRHSSVPCRVMLHNRPALAVMPDEFFLQILEILEELKNEGILDRVAKRLEAEHKKRNAWFWSKSWQKKECIVNREIKAKRINRSHSAEDFIRGLNS